APNAPAHESLGMALRAATWLGRGAPLVAVPEHASALAAAPAVAAPAATPSASSASPAAASREPAAVLTLEQRGDEVVATVADRRYRVRGLAKNLSPDALRVNLLVQRDVDVHVDTLDLYVARARGLFVAQAAKELGLSEETVKREVGALILALEARVTEQIAAALSPAAPASATPAMTEADRAAALALLRDPTLLDRIV